MSLTHHIERLKAKPAHVRERIALGVSGGVTTLVALGWLAAMGSSGSFAVAGNSVAAGITPPEEVSRAFSEGQSGLNEALGAAGAALGSPAQGAAAVTVVDVASSSTLDASASSDATVIPF